MFLYSWGQLGAAGSIKGRLGDVESGVPPPLGGAAAVSRGE